MTSSGGRIEELGMSCRIRWFVSVLCGCAALALPPIGAAIAATLDSSASAASAPRDIAPLVSGDERIIVRTHQIATPTGVLKYESRAGRLPIRNDENGEIRAYIFFVAYVAKPGTSVRPLTFLWNGGPTTNSLLVHTELFGPRRLDHDRLVDNAQTLLRTSDLVFMDPVGTGFSRPATPDYEKEFLSTLGDFAETAEFIRAYREKFRAQRQPLFLGGESYGTWRVCGTSEILAKRGEKVAGVLLISGGTPGSQMPFEFSDAMYVPARTAAAFFHHKLAPDLMQDREATLKAVNDWITSTYLPALSRRDALTDSEREEIVQALARFTGVRADQIDHTTLVMSNREYLTGLFDGKKTLNTFDMRIAGQEPADPARAGVLGGYLRDDLGYATDLAYTGLEDGYMPMPGPDRRSTGDRWAYNHVEVTPELLKRMKDGSGPPASQPWLQNAMRIDRQLRVFVAAGRYDSLNMCEGNVLMSAKLEADLSRRFSDHCYEGGHMMYRDSDTRLKLSADIDRFIVEASHTMQAPL
jgi:carboxypeptidase C (cathepsin A)